MLKSGSHCAESQGSVLSTADSNLHVSFVKYGLQINQISLYQDEVWVSSLKM